MADQPLLVFIIYAREDEPFRAELKAQLLPMERAGVLRVWTDRELLAGEHWEPAIKKQLNRADLILLLVSSDYFQSEYIHEVEIREALQRHERGEARVIPVIVRPCDWEADPVISSLQVLPTDGVPVNDTRHWHTRETAWVDVVRGARRALQQLREERAAAEAERRRHEADATRAQEDAVRRAEAAETARRQAAQAEARERARLDAEAARRQAEENARREEAAAWPQALAAGTPDAFQAYLSAYPNGAYAREARRQIKHGHRAGVEPAFPLRKVVLAAGVGLALLIAAIAYWKDPAQPAGAGAKETAAPEAVTRCAGCPEMVPVQGGRFTMGCKDANRDGECYDWEKPPHEVTVGDFYIGKYEVTQAEWRRVMGSDPAELYNKGCDQCPVERVSWNDIQEFIKKLNAQTGKKYRLPTEAEWEYAARGGNQSKGYLYSGSNTVGEVAWYDGNAKTGNTSGAEKTTRPVGTKKANELGIHDMSGNVWEWVEDDWHSSFAGAPADDRAWVDEGSYRVYRGGSWYFDARYCRAACRNGIAPDGRALDIGFRLALSPQ